MKKQFAEHNNPEHVISINDEDKISKAIADRKTFKVLCGSSSQKSAVGWLEREIEKQGLKCRVYTSKRAGLMAASLIPTGVTQVAGLVSGIAIGVHNLATYNPDYEIVKDTIGSDISVIFKIK